MNDWNANAAKYGFFNGSIVDARLNFVESAFYAYTGKWASNRRTPSAIEVILLGSMIHNERLLLGSDRTKQEVAERYVIVAASFRALTAHANRQHNATGAAERVRLRTLAAAALQGDLAISAPTYGIDYLPCVLSDLAKTGFLTCDQVLHFYDVQ